VSGLLAEGFSPAAIWAAAVRDLTTQSTQLLARMSIELGPHRYVTIAGGWARNGSVLAEKRRQLGEITVSTLREAGSTGAALLAGVAADIIDRKSTRLNSSHVAISYAVFCLKKKKKEKQ